jgi:hypothetical protein
VKREWKRIAENGHSFSGTYTRPPTEALSMRCLRLSWTAVTVSPLSFPKIASGWIRAVRQNHRMIGGDACNPALTRNVHRRLFKSRCRLEAENLFLRHQLSIALRRTPLRVRLRGSDRALLVWMARLWPADEQGKPGMGRVPDPWRTPDAGVRGCPVNSVQIHDAGRDRFACKSFVYFARV